MSGLSQRPPRPFSAFSAISVLVYSHIKRALEQEHSMHRREFLIRSTTALGATWLTSKKILNAFATQQLPAKFSASDTVTLGSTGIKTSRLAMGTGTVGSGHHSNQTALGVKGLSDLLLNGYDHGLRFFDAADTYGSHP